MDDFFLMGKHDGLIRTQVVMNEPTFISPNLHTNLMIAAIKKACHFYGIFFGKDISTLNYGELANEYKKLHLNALEIGLFKPGGVTGKDHLNLWCLNQVLSPKIYVESGVFIGSSLHAFVESSIPKKIFAIDPDLSKLMIPKEKLSNTTLIDKQDFSQIDMQVLEQEALVYFDDHINTADRILQSHQKGFRYALFDDSTGMEGICQRLYPAIPTVPMIMNCHLLNVGDEISWSIKNNQFLPPRSISRRKKSQEGWTRICLKLSQDFLDKCYQAKKIIKQHSKIPDLGEFIPQIVPKRTPDTSKFLVELSQS